MSPEVAPQLREVYAPIQAELERLDEFLSAHFRSDEPFIRDLLHHVEAYGGKRIRPALLLLVGKLLGPAVGADHVKIAAVVELIHTATLVHDDILDDSALRRGAETLHRRWGERAGVLLGDFLYSRAFALSTEVPGMAAVLSRATNTICEGELLQIAHRFQPDIDEALYFEIIRKKTAILHAVACSLGARLSGADAAEVERLYSFGLDLGMAFQIIDDCLDYSGVESVVGKSLGTDLHQGKVTLPLIYLIEHLGPTGGREVLESLRRPLSPEEEGEITRLVREQGTLREALDRAREFVGSARTWVAECSPALRESLDLAAEYVLRRQS